MSAIPKLLILLLFFSVTSRGQSNNPPSSCSSSSCGNVRISFPFRLKTEARSCGFENSNFELDCLNNQTILSVRSKTYFVQEINYDEYGIRLVDPNINRANLSSCPLYSNNEDDWHYTLSSYLMVSNSLTYLNRPVLFVHCLNPVNSSTYVPAPFCGNRSNSFSNSSDIHSYVVAAGERFLVSDLEDSCTVDKAVYATVRKLFIRDNSSLASIYDALGNGFELSWYRVLCRDCERDDGECSFDGKDITCKYYCKEDTPIYKRSFKCQFEYYGLFVGLFGSFAIAGLLVLRFLLGFPILVGIVVYKWRRRHLSMDETIEEFLKGQNNLTPIKYSYSEIKKMTNNFNQRLGEGAYGTVYKGKLRSGPYVAVKMMMGQSMSSEQEFISEVGTIGRIHHVNVVQLIGFCVEGSKCALVYEFLPNGSLDRYIFNQQGLEVVALRYEKMFEIALGVARGIDYLHRGCVMQILHFDIKPHNILLDEKFDPKISDFGLAKLYPTDGSIVNITAARGTMGYMAPEMFYKNVGGVSYKADVYSFGMLLMEMVGKRKNMNPFADDVGQIYFPSWVYDQLSAGKELEVKDATEEERKMMTRLIMVALWCIQMKPSDRPPMNRVVEMLEDDVEMQLPPKPFMAPRQIPDDRGITTTSSL